MVNLRPVESCKNVPYSGVPVSDKVACVCSSFPFCHETYGATFVINYHIDKLCDHKGLRIWMYEQCMSGVCVCVCVCVCV